MPASWCPRLRRNRLAQAPPLTAKNAKSKNIQVSPAVLDAARRSGDELLQDLRTAPGGLTQTEAEQRARTTGPNEVAQEKPQGWPIRLLKIIRNPLVILLATLSAVSFATGDPRAGTVMAMMVALSVGLRFWQEARADAAAAKLKAVIHVTATVIRDGKARDCAPRPGARGHYPTVCWRHDSGRRPDSLVQRSLCEPREPHRRITASRESS